MSFRGRLTFFFVAIVVVPMIAVALLVVEVSNDSRSGKADARLSTALEASRVTYDDALARAAKEVERIANLDRVGPALQAGNERYLSSVAETEVGGSGPVTVGFFDAAGMQLASAGIPSGVASSRQTVELPSKGEVGSIEVAMLDPKEYAADAADRTATKAAVVSNGELITSTADLGTDQLPSDPGGVTIQGPDGDLRAVALKLGGAGSDTQLVLAVTPEEGFAASQPLVIAVLAGFLALATLLIFVVLRSLQGQIAEMLAAARRIGGGDFSEQVPVEGNDEMAGLASEFNKMSDQLSEQMGLLRRQREQLDESVQRLGEAFAAGLDRTALLEIVLETAIAACEADSGRIELLAEDAPAVTAGRAPEEEATAALDGAAHDAIDARGLAEDTVGQQQAVAYPLVRADDRDAVLGTMGVVRTGRPFQPAEHEVLRYLIGQASVSIQNVGLHERVAEQAVTDELTGLSNNRHFREWMENETARTARFGGELSLVLLDIDNFKNVNDTYGHLQGDAVLESLGRMIRLESRGIDEPARYGGEEFVLALPETPREGAIEVAERLRERIETTEVPGVEGNQALRVTASLGVATMPADGGSAREIIAAADEALYRAKRSGKNRVVAAG